jgi:hypothetical protein
MSKHVKSLAISAAAAGIVVLTQWSQSIDLGGVWAPLVTGGVAVLVNALKIWIESQSSKPETPNA